MRYIPTNLNSGFKCLHPLFTCRGRIKYAIGRRKEWNPGRLHGDGPVLPAQAQKPQVLRRSQRINARASILTIF
jgi:hypothetical protein